LVRYMNKYSWALTCVFAAVQLVMTLFPLTIPIGGTGGYLSLGLVSAPIIGYFLGTFFGASAVLIGSLIGIVIYPAAAVYGYFTPLAPAAAAFVAGRIKSGKLAVVPLVYIVSIVIFVIGPLGMFASGFVWFDVAALVLSLLLLIRPVRRRVEDGLNFSLGGNYVEGAFAVWLLVFVSVMADHVVRSTIGAYYFLFIRFIGFPPMIIAEFYTTVIFAYPIESVLLSVIGFLVILLAVISMQRTNFYQPTLASPDSEEFIQEKID
jgi:hypothetical protein